MDLGWFLDAVGQLRAKPVALDVDFGFSAKQAVAALGTYSEQLIDDTALPRALVAKRAALALESARRNERSALWRALHPVDIVQTSYTPAELSVLHAATVRWPAPDALAAYPNGRTLVAEFRAHCPLMLQDQPGAAAAAWREPLLVGIAYLIGDDIRSSRSWRSPLFDEQRIRVDLDATLRDVALRAHRIWRVHANTVSTGGSGAAADRVHSRNDEVRQAAEMAWQTLLGLVRQLADYRERLRPLDDDLDAIDALQHNVRALPDDAVLQLYADAIGNEFRRDELARAAADLEALHADVDAQIGFLRRFLRDPAVGLPVS